MNIFYSFLEKPQVFNIIQKILGLLFNFNKDGIGRYLKEEIKLSSSENVLDIGCGTGRHARIFRGGQYFGIDNNLRYIEYAKSKEGENFLVMDATKLNFPEETFDCLICAEVLHHLNDQDLVSALKEMHRICKRDGKIYIIDAVFPSKVNLLGYLLLKFDRGRYARKLPELHGLLKKYNFVLHKEKLKDTFPYQISAFFYQKP